MLAHMLTKLKTSLAGLIHQVYSSSQLLRQVIATTQAVTSHHLRQSSHHSLAHALHLSNLTHSIRAALEHLAHKHTLNHSLPALAQTATVKQLRHLCLRYHASISQLLHHRSSSSIISIKLSQRLMTPYHVHHTPKQSIVHHLAKLHSHLSTALTLLLTLVELRKGFRRVRHLTIWHKHHTRVLKPFNLLRRKTKLAGMPAKIHIIFRITTIQSSNFTSHGTAVTRQHHTITTHHHRALQRTAVIISSHATRHLLGLSVTLIVTVIHRLTIHVHRVTLSLRKTIRSLVRSTRRTTLRQHIMTGHHLTIRQSNLICTTIYLRSILPLLLNGRSHSVTAQSLLLGSLLRHLSLALLLLRHGIVIQRLVLLLARTPFLKQHLVTLSLHRMPVVHSLLSLSHTSLIVCLSLLVSRNVSTHLRSLALNLFKILLSLSHLVLHKSIRLLSIKTTLLEHIVMTTLRSRRKPVLLLHRILPLANNTHRHRSIFRHINLHT